VTREPHVRVEPFTTEGASGSWTVRWRITNDGDRPVRLLAAQHPHAQFRTPETRFDREVGAGAVAEIVLPVRFDELPGAVVENPFLIVRLRDGGDWRLLARVRVIAGARGEPLAGQAVVVTAQRAGPAD
jgi:hypothetical protein